MIYGLSRKHSDKQVVQFQYTMKENVMDVVYMFGEMIFHVLAITFNTKYRILKLWNDHFLQCLVIYFVFFKKLFKGNINAPN